MAPIAACPLSRAISVRPQSGPSAPTSSLSRGTEPVQLLYLLLCKRGCLRVAPQTADKPSPFVGTAGFVNQPHHVAATHDERPVGSAGNQIVVEEGCCFEHNLFLLGRVDRKSTRLNSSHVRISYAVFCL